MGELWAPSPEVTDIWTGKQHLADFQGCSRRVTLEEPLPLPGPELLHLGEGALGSWDSTL